MRADEREQIFSEVYELVTRIPRGKVVTYGDIAAALGINPRHVGYVLHNNPFPGRVPCHRVLSFSGKTAATFAFGGGSAQQKLLENEGIIFHNGRTKLARYRFHF